MVFPARAHTSALVDIPNCRAAMVSVFCCMDQCPNWLRRLSGRGARRMGQSAGDVGTEVGTSPFSTVRLFPFSFINIFSHMIRLLSSTIFGNYTFISLERLLIVPPFSRRGDATGGGKPFPQFSDSRARPAALPGHAQ